jgi:hypothetical protein
MGIPNDKVSPISARIAATEKLYNEAELGASADTVLRALDPLIERRLGLLLDQFSSCTPELGALLDLRGKISEIWRMRKEILIARERGRTSWESLQAILTEGGENGGLQGNARANSPIPRQR